MGVWVCVGGPFMILEALVASSRPHRFAWWAGVLLAAAGAVGLVKVLARGDA